jgi:hypothetical protein
MALRSTLWVRLRLTGFRSRRVLVGERLYSLEGVFGGAWWPWLVPVSTMKARGGVMGGLPTVKGGEGIMSKYRILYTRAFIDLE